MYKKGEEQGTLKDPAEPSFPFIYGNRTLAGNTPPLPPRPTSVTAQHPCLQSSTCRPPFKSHTHLPFRTPLRNQPRPAPILSRRAVRPPPVAASAAGAISLSHRGRSLKCSHDVSTAFCSAICLCYFVLQPKILGFPHNSTKLLIRTRTLTTLSKNSVQVLLGALKMVETLFEDIFRIDALDPDGKKFDRVSRISARSEQFDMLMYLDINTEIYPMYAGEKFMMVLASTLNLDGTPDSGYFTPGNRKSLADKFDYVMQGKLYRISEESREKQVKADIYVSFGGLLMMLKGDPSIAARFELDQKLFILIRKV
ncbi:hypothetical protein ACS0TY_011881 [Phlomoides rotata]